MKLLATIMILVLLLAALGACTQTTRTPSTAPATPAASTPSKTTAAPVSTAKPRLQYVGLVNIDKDGFTRAKVVSMDNVTLIFNSSILASIQNQDLGLNIQVKPGQIKRITVTPPKVGNYTIRCTSGCQAGHDKLLLEAQQRTA